MIDTGITIKLYSFAELIGKAKEKAIEDHRRFMLSMLETEDYRDMAEGDEKEMQRLYDSEWDYYDGNDEPIIENIEINEYLFFENGELAHTVQYCGSHPLAGQTHLFLNGVDYNITDKVKLPKFEACNPVLPVVQ